MPSPLLPVSTAARARAQALLDFIDASPSPWHVADSAAALLEAAGYGRLDEADTWHLAPGARHYVVRDGSTLAAFRIGSAPLAEAGLRLIGAHTDSPGLRVKPLAGEAKGDWLRLGVEVYGGPILATFADRDLSLAGRVALRAPEARLGVQSRLVRFAAPLLRIPNLAIHLNRKVNEDGLKLDRQSALPPILGAVQDGLPAADHLTRLLADALDVDPGQLLGFELNVYDTQPGAFFGPQQEFIADSQLDNLGSCHAALMALLDSDVDAPQASAVCFLFDHEEVGSTSAKGADGSFLDDVLERIALCRGLGREDYRRALARSMLVSADMAHAFHPGHAGRLRRPAPCAPEPRPGHQDQRQPALYVGEPVGRRVPAGLRARRSALAKLCAAQRPGLRQHHRPAGGLAPGAAQRGRGQPDVGHAQPARERRGRRSRRHVSGAGSIFQGLMGLRGLSPESVDNFVEYCPNKLAKRACMRGRIQIAQLLIKCSYFI